MKPSPVFHGQFSFKRAVAAGLGNLCDHRIRVSPGINFTRGLHQEDAVLTWESVPTRLHERHYRVG